MSLARTGLAISNAAGLPQKCAQTAWACVAVALPTLIAYNLPPSATFLNQAASALGWGGYLLWLSTALAPRVRCSALGAPALLGAFALLIAAAVAASWWAAAPWSLSLSSAGTLLMASLAVLIGTSLSEEGLGLPAFRSVSVGLAVAGFCGAVIGTLQVYAPSWIGDWIAHSAIPGRAVGNLRQPNHLSSVLLWSIVAAIWLGENGTIRRSLALALSVFILFVIVLSGSRTGALGTMTLAAWGLLDRRLSRASRVALLLSPVAYVLLWLGATEWAHWSHQMFGGETRFSTAGDVSSSRFAIWSNTLDLIKAHPWFGVGFGEFNFAWTLTPFPHRPVAFFDHAHNLVLQFAVELGLPLAALVLGLLGWALFEATRNAIVAGRDQGAGGAAAPPYQRAALVIVILVAVHSMLEYPLWYAYFLLPTAFAFGLCLGGRTGRTALSGSGGDPAVDSSPASIARTAAGAEAAPVELSGAVESADAAPLNASSQATAVRLGGHPTRPLVLASMLMMGCGVLALYDYAQVVVIFSPPANATPLEARIAAGQRSVLFAHHADYAAVTTEEPGRDLGPFKRAPHYLLDSRLMMAWAQALAATGDVDRARYIAARLREFHNEQAEPFFAPCVETPKPGVELPFQCQPPQRSYTYEDFR